MGQTSHIQLTQTGIQAKAELFDTSRDEFARTGIVMLPGFLTPAMMAPFLRNLRESDYRERHEYSFKGRHFGKTLCIPRSEPAVASLHFMLNRPELFRLVENLTGSPKLANYVGRIHLTAARDGDQHIDWHDDATDFRTVGLNINLSTETFEGGAFMLRNEHQVMTREIADWKLGDAFLFRIGDGWQHRLSPVTRGERTVGVGWFRTEPSWEVLATSYLRQHTILTSEVSA